MLALLCDYFGSWAILKLIAFIGVQLFGVSATLLFGARYIAKIPRISYWKCLIANILASIAALVAFSGIFFGLVLIAPIAALAAYWLTVKLLVFKKASKSFRCFLLTLPVLMIPMILLVSNSLGNARDVARRASCLANLREVGRQIQAWQQERGDKTAFPTSMEQFLRERNLPSNLLQCPGSRFGEPPIFYRKPSSISNTGEQFLACDYKGYHRHGLRNVLFADLHVATLTEEEFARGLDNPDNREFRLAFASSSATVPVHDDE